MTASTTQGQVAVRMYRGILGDCFLLRYPEGGTIRHILIDCGVLQGVAGAKELMKRIVDDIHQTTGGQLDLLVVTHEHHDHLSGFLYERQRFLNGDFKIGELWLAWTENADDPQAAALHARFDRTKRALVGLMAFSGHGTRLADDPRIKTVHGLANFIEPKPGKGSLTTLQMLKTLVSPGAIRYLEPGDVVQPAAMGSLNVMVMGPPRSEQRLRKDLPSKGAGKEVYLTSLDEAMAVEDRGRRLTGQKPLDPDLPFARPYQRDFAQVEKTIKTSGVGADATVSVEQRYFCAAQSERRIEDEWLDSAETLALKMDSDTNNTSLVLAFELPDGQVLLFPGDAQVGNWLSWSDQTYPRTASPDQRALKTKDDILARVTLYKVGHHCSHNATLRTLGLEKMRDPRLVAMIPVVSEVADSNKWNMPYPELLEALKERTRQRILKGDGVPADEKKIFSTFPTDPNNPATLTYEPGEGLWVELLIPFG